jgi:hypothetical protein
MQVYRGAMNQQGGPPGHYPGGYGPPQPPIQARKPITGSAETMALHAMSIDPKTGLPIGEKPPASTAAVIALVCGILICLGPLTGITAIVTGVIGRSKSKQQPESVGGAGMATAGIVLGCVNLLLSFVAGLILILQYLAT